MDFFGFTDNLTWQDGVLTAGSLIFLFALIPTILGPSKPAPFTSFSTGTVLLIFAVTYITLDLYFACVTTAATGIAWLIILVQSLRQGPHLPPDEGQGEEG